MFKIKGATQRETIENSSFLLMVVSAVMVAIGIGLGSFVKYTVYFAVFGAAILLVGIVLFIISQLMEHKEKV